MKSKNLTDIGKLCSSCGEDKPLKEFGKVSKTRDWLKAQCRDCCNEADRKRRKAPKVKRLAADYARRYRQGIRVGPKPVVDHVVKQMAWRLGLDYVVLQKTCNRLYEKQYGRCAICGVAASDLSKRLCMDHDHETNKIRGLLCTACNAGIGSLHDSADLCKRAADYLTIKDVHE